MSGPYASTKYAVEAITDALRMELRPFGIRVIGIRPGPILTEFNEVANELTGDLMARTDPDYKPIYQASGAGVGKLFAGLTVPGPKLISDLILEAVMSDAPKAVYAAGPFTEEILAERTRLDDDAFDRFLTEKTGLAGLTVGSGGDSDEDRIVRHCHLVGHLGHIFDHLYRTDQGGFKKTIPYR